MTDTVLWFLIFTLLIRTVQQRRHVRSLRRQLGPDRIDTWTLRCENCGRSLRGKHALVCTALMEYPDSRPDRTVTRAWHADRPKCSADFATDPQVMDTYLNGERS